MGISVMWYGLSKGVYVDLLQEEDFQVREGNKLRALGYQYQEDTVFYEM